MDFDYINKRLPFPLVRIIIEYVGLFPKNLLTYVRFTREHMDNKYCHRCGEYIIAGNRTTNLKHLSCRNRRYVKDTNRTRNYHVKIITILELLYEEYSHNLTPPTLWCPLIFYSKQPKSYFRLVQDEDQNVEWVYLKNDKITSVHDNPKFSIIPTMFKHNEHYNLFDLTQQETRVKFIQLYKRHTKNDLFRWMFSQQYHKQYNIGKGLWFAMEKIWQYVLQNPDMKKHISSVIGIQNILRFHTEWAKDILYKHPIILQYTPEKRLKRFFNENKEWFLQYVEDCPTTLKYITLYNETVEEPQIIDTKL